MISACSFPLFPITTVRGVGYNDKGPNAEDPAITGLIAEPKIITKQGKTAVVSVTSVKMPKESNTHQFDEMEEDEGLFLDLLENITYLGEAKACVNFNIVVSASI